MNRPTILLIDDEPSMLLLLSQILKKNYSIVTATDGLKAIAWLSSGERPDLIITDVNMPVLGGADLVKNLRCSTKFSDIPVIILSANEANDCRETALKNGVFEYFLKPFEPAKLKEAVAYALKEIHIH